MINAIDYGQQIDKTAGHAHFKLFLSLKRRVLAILQKAFEKDTEAYRYFCGFSKLGQGDVSKTVIDDAVYVFDKDAISHTLELLKDSKADGIAIFNGIRDSGRPTVLIFPYKYKTEKGVRKANVLNILLDEGGSQHPGTGGSGVDDNGNPTGVDEIPAQYNVTHILD